MNESLTLSKKTPERNSMNYAALRELGIQRIQELAGQLWTDYNSHDPGITMLEVFSYVLTDMGYRVNYEIKDIIAQELGSPDYYDIKNFYTAGEILPVCPVTFNDYRKLMIDVDVYDPANPDCEHVGIKNAWIEKAENPAAEHKIYVDKKHSKLSLSPIEGIVPDENNSYYVGVLYNVLLEFDKCDAFGDLNSSFSEVSFYLTDPDDNLEQIRIDMRIDFMRWDEEDIVWDAPLNIAAHIEQIRLRFPEKSSDSELTLQGGLNMSFITSKKGETGFVSNAFLNDMIPEVEILFNEYQLKVAKVFEIIHALKKSLHQNRNLCEDFFKFNALKVEEILLCSDIELNQQADVETVEAEILHAISNFLSPKVYFYTLEEMVNKCRNAPQYALASITKNKSIFTISEKFEEDVNRDDTITVFASDTNKGEYTVKCIRQNKENPNHTDIEVLEEVLSDEIGEEAYLIKGTIDESLCLTIDQIFEGPRLRNGFIDEEELTHAERRKKIHVSDLIRIIMDVEGVVAVKNIQIANRPQDNDDNIESKSVKWCLDLAFDNNYVPRLNIGDSKLTFYKDQLPFIADSEEVESLMDALEKADRPQKRFKENSNTPVPKTDIPVPIGEFKDLDDYTSLQEDFPLVYGIGSEGIAGLGALDLGERALREAQAKQLKGFLMFFDQLSANYLSQLHHVKDLFSMNGEKNEFGEYKIDKTYFSQALLDPTATVDPLNLAPLYVDKSGHLVALQQIVEDKELYETRRNKFLDHLLGRFAETFTDYALLMYKADKSTAGAELIEDKLKFLNAYPQLSASRGKAFNYLSPCDTWSVNNISGLEQRASLLTGMAFKEGKELIFSANFKIIESSGSYTFGVCKKPSNAILLETPDGLTYDSEGAAKIAIEQLIVNGSCKEKFRIVTPPGNDSGTVFMVQLVCDEMVIAESRKKNFTSNAPGGDADLFIDDVLENILAKEFFENHEANRKNLSMPINNYFQINNIIANLTPPDGQPPQYEIDFEVFAEPFRFINKNLIFSGTLIGAANPGDDMNAVIEKGENDLMKKLCQLVFYGTDRKQYATITDLSGDLKFILCNNHGEEIGRSIGKNFNKVVTAELDALTPKEVEVESFGTFAYSNAIDRGLEVELQFQDALPVDAIGAQLSYTKSFDILAIDLLTRTIEVNVDIDATDTRFYKGDPVSINGSESNDGNYTIFDFEENGATTIIHLKELIATDDISGELSITRSYPIANINGKKVFIEGGEEEREIQTLIDFFTTKFLSHEGFHLIEHTIIRPRINEDVFVATDAETLTGGIADFGDLFFKKIIPIASVNATQNTITVNGDLTSEVLLRKVTIEGGSPNDGDYNYRKVTFKNGQTKIRVKDDILFDLPTSGLTNGQLVVYKKTAITALNAPNQRLRVTDADALNLQADDLIIIWKSENKVNDGRYKIASISDNGGNIVDITIGQKETKLEDALLPVYFDKECESCNNIDPYSCVISVVLPYWPGRFTNMDIRKYIEKTIRLEAPAHLLLNICWIDCEQMEAFEASYKKWLIQIGKKEIDKALQAEKLAEFIDAITKLRNIYPSGTLHSCDDDDTFEGSIILNNSVLGTF